MIADDDRDVLIAAVASAWRPRDAHGRILAHPAWHDLDEAGRREAFEATLVERFIDAAYSKRGLSATARAVLARIPHE